MGLGRPWDLTRPKSMRYAPEKVLVSSNETSSKLIKIGFDIVIRLVPFSYCRESKISDKVKSWCSYYETQRTDFGNFYLSKALKISDSSDIGAIITSVFYFYSVTYTYLTLVLEPKKWFCASKNWHFFSKNQIFKWFSKIFMEIF